MSKVIVRPFNESQDAGFLFSSWPKGVYHSSAHHIELHKEEFFRIFYDYVKEMIASADISIACMSDDHDTIIGYSVIYECELQWIYVKELFRRHGIATLLVKNQIIDGFNEQNLTKAGLAIIRKHPELNQKEKEEYGPPNKAYPAKTH